MSAIKRQYMNWCEQHNIEPDDDLAWLHKAVEQPQWVNDFNHWLDQITYKHPLSDGELNNMEGTDNTENDND